MAEQMRDARVGRSDTGYEQASRAFAKAKEEEARACSACGRSLPAPGEAVEYTQGICSDGAAILKDGVMMTIEEILATLNNATAPPQVTDAMVEAACAAFSDYWGTMSPGGKLLAIKSMRKALEAAHAARGG
jgi:recombinational DNA repair protein (RecF pathway)